MWIWIPEIEYSENYQKVSSHAQRAEKKLSKDNVGDGEGKHQEELVR